jgi:hypothetical protein
MYYESVVICNKNFVPNAVIHTVPVATRTTLPKRDAGCVNRQHLVFITIVKTRKVILTKETDQKDLRYV